MDTDNEQGDSTDVIAETAEQIDADAAALAEQLPSAPPEQVTAISAELWSLEEKASVIDRLVMLEDKVSAWQTKSETPASEVTATTVTLEPLKPTSRDADGGGARRLGRALKRRR